jgi:hypothetical protein
MRAVRTLFGSILSCRIAGHPAEECLRMRRRDATIECGRKKTANAATNSPSM